MANAQGIRAIVISSGPHKGVGVEGAPITDEQIDAIRAIVDGLADQFIGAVARGRNMELSSVRKLADGRSWLAPYARELGLIDAIERGNIIMNIERNKRMEELSETIKLEEAIAAAKAEAAEAEMARMKALREAFPDDPQFAMEQFEKGADLLQAKAAYCDILSERTKQLAEQMKQNEKGKKQPSAESGAEPIPAGPSQAEPDDAFLSAVQQYQAEGLSRGAAIRKAVLTRPEAYESHRASRTIAIKC
jgi:ClpP class serine protease